MALQPDAPVRDPAQTAAAYERYVALADQQAHDAAQNGPHRFSASARYGLRAAKAAYSAGHPIGQCRDRLERAVSFWERFLHEGTGGRIAGLPRADEFVELASASCLVGRSAAALGSFERQFTGTDASHGEKALVRLLCGLLTDAPRAPTETEVLGLSGIRQFALLPQVCNAVIAKDHAGFTAALDTFLLKSWKPAIERAAKGDLEINEYFGKWSLLSAAACRMFGTVPLVSKAASRYLPAELV